MEVESLEADVEKVAMEQVIIVEKVVVVALKMEVEMEVDVKKVEVEKVEMAQEMRAEKVMIVALQMEVEIEVEVEKVEMVVEKLVVAMLQRKVEMAVERDSNLTSSFQRKTIHATSTTRVFCLFFLGSAVPGPVLPDSGRLPRAGGEGLAGLRPPLLAPVGAERHVAGLGHLHARLPAVPRPGPPAAPPVSHGLRVQRLLPSLPGLAPAT